METKNQSILPEDIFDPEDHAAITAKNLVKKYGDIVALNGLDLKIEKGELFGLLGPNGAGKTTLINILCGLLMPDSGTAYIDNFDLKKFTIEMKKRIGMCPQEPAYFDYLTGRENIEFFGNLYSVPKEELKKSTDMLIEKLNLSETAKRKAKTYSGGMIRRLNMIIALVHNPDIIFLDEPTVAMDPQSRHAVWDFIQELNQKRKTIILTSHYIEEAEFLCDRVGIIDHGKLIELGEPKKLLEKYGAKNLEDVFIELTGRKIREGM